MEKGKVDVWSYIIHVNVVDTVAVLPFYICARLSSPSNHR
jgi:hypothetical protein